jgi:uncharacterized phage protein (TIGR02216 family)
MTEQIPWKKIMRVGLVTLGLTTDDFWKLTFREFACMTCNTPSSNSITRKEFEELKQMFPDK